MDHFNLFLELSKSKMFHENNSSWIFWIDWGSLDSVLGQQKVRYFPLIRGCSDDSTRGCSKTTKIWLNFILVVYNALLLMKYVIVTDLQTQKQLQVLIIRYPVGLHCVPVLSLQECTTSFNYTRSLLYLVCPAE